MHIGKTPIHILSTLLCTKIGKNMYRHIQLYVVPGLENQGTYMLMTLASHTEVQSFSSSQRAAQTQINP